MEQCDKVILFGYLDGYTYELNGITNYVVALETGERVEIPVGGVMSVDEFVEKDKIKLKDVIARIKKLDLGTQKVWLNEILNELGSDYGTFKYKVGYKQGKFDGAMEREKVTIPQFVADYIDFKKTYDFQVYGAMRVIEDHYDKRVQEWFYKGNIETFARAWLDGYHIEKEKRYYVRFKNMESNDFNYLNFIKFQHAWVLSSIKLDKKFRTEHTKKQLEDADFGWVFDCPGIEIEEVTE